MRDSPESSTRLVDSVDTSNVDPAPTCSIGVVIPAYRCHQTIGETLERITDQTVAPRVVVVVVDGPDPDLERLLGDRPSGIDVLVLPDHSGGPATPRNAGAAHLLARHDLDGIWFLDSDDVPHPRFLEVVSRVMAEDPDADLVCTRFRNWRANEALEPFDDPPVEALGLEIIGLDRYLDNTGSVLPSFTVVRSRALPSLRTSGEPFDPAYPINQDYDLFVRLLHRLKGVRIDWRGGAYRLHDGGISARGSDAWLCRTSADRDLRAHFRDLGEKRIEGRMRLAEGSSLRKAARHLWRRGGTGDRPVAIRLLIEDIRENGSIRSLLLCLTLPLGLDAKSRLMPRQGDTRRPRVRDSGS